MVKFHSMDLKSEQFAEQNLSASLRLLADG